MKKYLAPIGALAVGIGIGLLIADLKEDKEGQEGEERLPPPIAETRFPERYRFVNPLLECDSYVASETELLISLRVKLKELVQQLENDHQVTDISVYYRDLNNGSWIGVNENLSFAPASMLKVPLMMALLKKAEHSPGLLDRVITVEPEDVGDYDSNIDDRMVKVGSKHTVSSLIESAIVYSDNIATNVLFKMLETSEVGQEPWKALGMPEPDESTPDDFLNVKDYSSFFRILYNATYLSKDHSEMALQLLSRTNFQQGIRAGIDSTVTIASKFGERGTIDSDVKQLHECGIVYDDQRPYLLCVMTRGTSWDDQAVAIQEIARLVHQNR